MISVFTTLPNRTSAEKLASNLVRNKLAACVQIVGPIKSVYRWKGKVENSREYLCIIKTTSVLYASLEKAILRGHPYEVPEIVALPVVRGNKDYLSWVAKEAKKR